MPNEYLHHRNQFDGSARQASACVPTSLANAIREDTNGRRDFSGSWVMNQLPVQDEDNPGTPGWTLNDARKVATKIGVTLHIGTSGWDGVIGALRRGEPVLLQGDSDRFPGGCSGKFDGNHCLVLYPLTRRLGGQVMLGDPICTDARWEDLSRVKAYAEKFNPSISYAYIPKAIVTPPDPKLYSQKELDAALVKVLLPVQLELTQTKARLADIRKILDRA